MAQFTQKNLCFKKHTYGVNASAEGGISFVVKKSWLYYCDIWYTFIVMIFFNTRETLNKKYNQHMTLPLNWILSFLRKLIREYCCIAIQYNVAWYLNLISSGICNISQCFVRSLNEVKEWMKQRGFTRNSILKFKLHKSYSYLKSLTTSSIMFNVVFFLFLEKSSISFAVNNTHLCIFNSIL